MINRLIEEQSLILIVDDTPTNLTVLSQVLSDAGFEIAIATSGERALEQVSREKPDLILLDIMMPGIGGFETCRRLKADPDFQNIPIIFITATSELENKVKALEIGAVDYIIKPFQEREVVSRVKIHVELCKMQLKLQQSEEQLTNILNSLQEVVWSAWLDPFEIIYLNPFVQAIYGLSPQSIIESPQLWIEGIVAEDLPLVQKYFFDSPRCGSVEFDYRVMGLDEQIHWLQCSASIQLDESTQRFRVDGILHDITECRLAEEKLVYAAQHDSLTNLVNRDCFKDRLTQTLKTYQQHQHPKFALLFLDLDRFKNVNDSLGHKIGDNLLIQVSQILVKTVRPTDLVARLGGDEFTILIEGIHEERDIFEICDRIQERLQSPIEVGEHLLKTTASIGIVISSNLYHCADDLLRDADIAMYQAKRFGKACYQLFSQEMYEKEAHYLYVETQLRNARQKQEFFLEYQPIIQLATEELTGFEALVRWQHPQLGLVSPGQFIPLAEEIGLIQKIGEYVLQEACRQMELWVRNYPQATHLTMSINVSSHQLETEYFPQQIKQILTQTNLTARNLKLEITESSLIENNQISRQNLKILKENGIHISLDDFGTGYSSLSYLLQFPVNTLKIDRSFINTMESNGNSLEIIRTIITLARTLNMDIVAEGLETTTQALALEQLNCDMVQGYLFSKPLSSEKATQYLQNPRSSILSINHKTDKSETIEKGA
ncbi:MAG: EAL domain-containing protein [Pleurocapsa sp.]